MNFNQIFNRIKQIDEGTVNECGDMPMMGAMMGSDAPRQQDSVTMNVSMNGSGAGGIRDLMALLKNIEQGEEHDADALLGVVAEPEVNVELDDSYANEPAEVTQGVEAVTQTGDDMHSKGDEAEKVNGGGNPMGLDEALVTRLQNHYSEIKLREAVSTNHRHQSGNPKVNSLEHHGHGEFTATVNGHQYFVDCPIDFGSSHDDEPKWVGSLKVSTKDGIALHHNDPVFRAIDDELDKLDPQDLSEVAIEAPQMQAETTTR